MFHYFCQRCIQVHTNVQQPILTFYIIILQSRKALSEDYDQPVTEREGWWRTYIRVSVTSYSLLSPGLVLKFSAVLLALFVISAGKIKMYIQLSNTSVSTSTNVNCRNFILNLKFRSFMSRKLTQYRCLSASFIV